MELRGGRRINLWHVLGFGVLVALFLVAIWIDLTTGLWQEAVILSGIVAGLLTFILTSLFFDSWVARSEHQRWNPVTRLALSDILHSLADEEHSEISRGDIVPRLLTVPDDHHPDRSHQLLEEVLAERRHITKILSRWAAFLTSSADVRILMGHIAVLGIQLDNIRDSVVQFDAAYSTDHHETHLQGIRNEVVKYNDSLRAAIQETEGILERLATEEDS